MDECGFSGKIPYRWGSCLSFPHPPMLPHSSSSILPWGHRQDSRSSPWTLRLKTTPSGQLSRWPGALTLPSRVFLQALPSKGKKLWSCSSYRYLESFTCSQINLLHVRPRKIRFFLGYEILLRCHTQGHTRTGCVLQVGEKPEAQSCSDA